MNLGRFIKIMLCQNSCTVLSVVVYLFSYPYLIANGGSKILPGDLQYNRYNKIPPKQVLLPPQQPYKPKPTTTTQPITIQTTTHLADTTIISIYQHCKKSDNNTPNTLVVT